MIRKLHSLLNLQNLNLPRGEIIDRLPVMRDSKQKHQDIQHDTHQDTQHDTHLDMVNHYARMPLDSMAYRMHIIIYAVLDDLIDVHHDSVD